jgi:dipeptidase E
LQSERTIRRRLGRRGSRPGSNATDWFPELAEIPAGLEGHDAVLDGEVVICENGRPAFHLLRRHVTSRGPPDPVAGSAPVRLYLSSFRIGACPDRLVALAGGRRAAAVANAMDPAPAEVRQQAVELEMAALSALGFTVEEVDLRDPGAADGLANVDVLWVRGGNTFALRAVLARSGADDRVRTLLEQDRLVYAGYSAGVCVLAPSLRGLEAVDPPEAVAETYGDEAAVVWEGLGILGHAVVPHVDSPDHHESEACTRVAERYSAEGVPHIALRDGQVLVVEGGATSICG